MVRRFDCIAWLVAGLAFLTRTAMACDLPVAETVTVASVIDGETLVLTDGRKVRLLGVKAPAAPLGWKGKDPWPFVAESTAALSRLASGAPIELRFDERRGDRHGHVLAHVFLVDGDTRAWLQEDLVAKGLVRVYSFADAHACVD